MKNDSQIPRAAFHSPNSAPPSGSRPFFDHQLTRRPVQASQGATAAPHARDNALPPREALLGPLRSSQQRRLHKDLTKSASWEEPSGRSPFLGRPPCIVRGQRWVQLQGARGRQRGLLGPPPGGQTSRAPVQSRPGAPRQRHLHHLPAAAVTIHHPPSPSAARGAPKLTQYYRRGPTPITTPPAGLVGFNGPRSLPPPRQLPLTGSLRHRAPAPRDCGSPPAMLGGRCCAVCQTPGHCGAYFRVCRKINVGGSTGTRTEGRGGKGPASPAGSPSLQGREYRALD